MKYIMTENDHKLIIESKKIEVFQSMIDSKLDHIRNHCDDNEIFDDVDDESCEDIDMIDRLEVLEVKYGTRDSKNSPNFVELFIKVYYSSLFHTNFDSFVYNIRRMLDKSVGLPVILTVVEEVNLSSSTEW
jgi:hypothetical protein